MNLRKLLLPALTAGLVGLMAAGMGGKPVVTHAAPQEFAVTLAGDAENPPVKGDAGGSARFGFDEATKRLDYAVTVSGLSPDQVTASHIHRGAAGVNGPIIYTLSDKGFTQVSGSITLTDADVADLKAGNLYVNIHSKDNPGGFARGQMFLNAPGGALGTVQAAIAAWNRGDAVAFLSYWTDSGIFDAFDGETRAAALEELPMFMKDTPIALSSLSNVQVRGTQVTGVLALVQGIFLSRTLESFTLEGGIWKISGEKDLPSEIPPGNATVDMKLSEFSFVYDRAQVVSATRPLAFKTSNVGKQDHEIALVRLNSSAPILELLNEGPDTPDIQFLAGEGPIKPGESKNVVLVSALPAGRYAFVCFLPDTDGTPHAFRGMVSEFNVGAGGAAGGTPSIRPPSTGDAGLAGRADVPLLAGIVLLTLSGISGVAVVVSRR